MGAEVVESWGFRVELKANEGEGLSSDLADRREAFESACRVLHHIVLNGGVASVVELHGLVDRLVRAAIGECHL